MFGIKFGRKNKKVIHRIKNISKLSEKGIRRAWFTIGKSLKKEANDSTLRRGEKRGRLYRVRARSSGRFRNHRASAPNQSHANLYGDLRRSIGWKVAGFDLKFGYGIVKNDAPAYAPAIEFGARIKYRKRKGSIRIRPRPTLKRSIVSNTRNTQNYLLEAVLSEYK